MLPGRRDISTVDGATARSLPVARVFALASFLILAALVTTRADTIYQPGGGKIVGEIVEERDEYVAIRTRGGGVLKVPRDEIDRIERGPVPPMAPPPQQQPPPPTPVPPQPTPPAAAGGAENRPPSTPSSEATPRKPAPSGERRAATPGAGITFGVDEAALAKPRARALLRWFEARADKVRAAIFPLVKARRKEALEFIMDPKRYPDANHGAEAQPEVDRLVGLLRRAFEDPVGEVLEGSPEARRLLEELDEVDDSAPLRARLNKALGFADRAAEEDASAAAAHNARVAQAFDPEEMACIELTNRYRFMFGLRALRADERLLRAARKHAQAMFERGFFDHNSPVPGMETPEKRVAAEGASYTAENIAFGSKTGEATFLQWYNSSGHHRNMLGEQHLTIGVGRYREHWTEDFGKDVLK